MIITLVVLFLLIVAGNVLQYLHTVKVKKDHLYAMEARPVHLTCGTCGLLVARFEQQADNSILCLNCKQAAINRANRNAGR